MPEREMRDFEGLRIGYLVQHFPPELGAAPGRVAEMALRWRDAGAEVTVITAMPNRPEGRIYPDFRGKLFSESDWNGIRVLRSWLFASPRHGFVGTIANNLSFMATAALQGALRARKLDVLIASSPPFFVHLAGEFLRRLHRLPLVLEVRDLWPDYIVEMGVLPGRTIPGLLLSLERRLLRRADAVVAVTDDILRRVEEKGVAPDRAHLLPNGVDPDRYFRSDERAPVPALERRNGEFLVGYLGNFGAGQGLETVLDAAHLLQQEDPTVRLVLAGGGTQRGLVEAKYASNGPANTLLHPPIPKEQTRAFYNACDTCLVPLAPLTLFRDAIPTKLLEVMACEVPVVAALEGRGARMIQNAGAGVVARPGDARSIADSVLAIKAWSEEKRRCAGQAGRDAVTRDFGREQIAERYLRLLATVAGAR
jgi:glycosyltransferase involved in cell wall biosynthesis